MFCKYCGKEIDNDSTFCPYCGKKQHDQHKDILLEPDEIISEAERPGKGTDTQQHESKPFAPEVQGKSEEKASEEIHKENRSSQSTAPKKQKKKLIAILVSVLVVIVLAAALFASGVLNGSPRELSASDIAKLSDSVLTLYVYDKDHDLVSTGSGFVVSDDKTIVTNYHVIEQGYFVEAVSETDVHYNVSGATFFDEAADIAVLQFETGTGLTPLIIADSSSAQVGDTVYAIGSPLGLKNTVSNGIISAIREQGNYSDIQITAPISSGSSGGALLNVYGEVIGITYASYSDGQNLNLAIPSVEFADKLQNGEIQRFEDIALFAAPLGNSVENYSTHETRLVQYGNKIYEAYNSDNEINVYDINTKTSKKLGISGTNLSIYHGVLYYVSSDNAVGTYDISTGEVCKNILLNYPSAAQVNSISNLYISTHGITVIYDVGFLEEALIQLDFDGKIIGSIDKLPSGVIVADADTLVGYDYKNWELKFISLLDLDSFSIPVDFEPGSLCADRNGYLYIADTTKSNYGSLVKFDLQTGSYTRISKPDASTYGCFVYDGEIYYPSKSGTMRMSVSGSGLKAVNTSYALNQICFSDNGKLYGIGTYPNADFLEYTEFYIRVNSNGSQLEILDNEEVKW